MEDLRRGPAVERVWIIWHALIGLGAGVLFMPFGPPFVLFLFFVVTSLGVILGVRICSRNLVTVGLVGLACTQIARAIMVWYTIPPLPTGSRVVASFLWVALAVGAVMEAVSVKHRGIS